MGAVGLIELLIISILLMVIVLPVVIIAAVSLSANKRNRQKIEAPPERKEQDKP